MSKCDRIIRTSSTERLSTPVLWRTTLRDGGPRTGSFEDGVDSEEPIILSHWCFSYGYNLGNSARIRDEKDVVDLTTIYFLTSRPQAVYTPYRARSAYKQGFVAFSTVEPEREAEVDKTMKQAPTFFPPEMTFVEQ